MSPSNHDVVRGFIEAMGCCDAETAGEYLAADMTTELMSPTDLGHVEGRAAFLETIRIMGRMVPGGIRPTILNLFGDGDHVTAECRGNGVMADGRPYANRYCWVFQLEGGKIRTVHEYLCTRYAADLLAAPFAALKADAAGKTG